MSPLGVGLDLQLVLHSVPLGVRVVHWVIHLDLNPSPDSTVRRMEATFNSSKFLGDGNREPNTNSAVSLFPKR